MPRPLDTYVRKRDFAITPEPRGSKAAERAGAARQFVVQKHDARRLHYDFRLEHRGVLKSWAVPKAPSLDPRDRRLAVQTEDHPLEYATFEGEIPENQYGAGSVLIWDRGLWRPLADPDKGLEEGKLDFELEGGKLNGRFTLVRMKEKDARKRQENWLLIKRTDDSAPAPPTRKRTAKKAAPRRTAAVPGGRRAALPEAPEPQLATAVDATPQGEGWIFEPKLDGYRLLCRVERGAARLITRAGNDWTARFPAIAAAAAALRCKTALLDGEAVIYDEQGLTSFQRLQNAIARADREIVLVAFDLLHLDGWDLRGTPLLARKERLAELLENAPAVLRYGEHVTEKGQAFFREACRLGLEGIVAKRAADPYREGRSRSWLKVKCLARQEFVIVGFTDPAGTRTGFGALLLGTREAHGKPLRYAGKVGTGFDERTLRSLRAKLGKIERRTAPIEDAPPRAIARAAHWVEPTLVAEIAFGEWTSDGRLRHPTFRGLREDKPAEEVTLERPAAPPPPPAETKGAAAKKRAAAGGARESAKMQGDAANTRAKTGAAAGKAQAKSAAAAARAQAKPGAVAAKVRLSSPDKVLFPEDDITKRQLAHYWEQVAEYALPFLAGRPLTLYRCPEGLGAQCFYQKHVGIGVPDVVPRVTITESEDPYAMVDSVESLLGLVQISVLEMHVWGSRAEHLDQPDVIVLDLDPDESLPWRAVVEAAREVKDRLAALGLAAFLRLTGGKGLHVVVPVVPGPEWPAVKKFTHAFVNEMVREAPRRFTASVSKSRRGGKIFVDYLRNDRESTAIAAYSPRARTGAPVALPIEWDELDPADGPPRYGLLEVPALLRARPRDPWEDFEAARRPLLE